MNNEFVVDSKEDVPCESAPVFREKSEIDRIFALLTGFLGFWFVYTFSCNEFSWNLKMFTMVYVIFVAGYHLAKNRKVAGEGWFWLVITAVLGLSYSEDGLIFGAIQIMLLPIAGAYAALSAGGNLLANGKSSGLILVDLWNALMVVPFYNFFYHIKILFGKSKEDGKTWFHYLGAIIIGIIIAIPILCIVLPLLGNADEQFASLLPVLSKSFKDKSLVFMVRLFFSLPVTAYLFGLFYGSVNNKNTDVFSADNIHKNMTYLRIVPNVASYTVFTVICLVYLLFIFFQTRYFFSAFAGVRPEIYTYAGYARQGFFELCNVAVVNLSVLTIINTFSRTPRIDSRGLRIFNIVLSVLTLILVLTAMSKMVLYIAVYGFTAKRITTMAFMIWLMSVFIMLIIWQFKRISIVRNSLSLGACIYALLCVFPAGWLL